MWEKTPIPCWWPPRSNVVNLLLPIASSSEAANRNDHKVSPQDSSGVATLLGAERTWMRGRWHNCYPIILFRQQEKVSPIARFFNAHLTVRPRYSRPCLVVLSFAKSRKQYLPPLEQMQLTLSICNNVVLPALSSPRKSNLACLFRRPREARTS